MKAAVYAIPDDVILRIFTRLGVRSLVRTKVVCKWWKRVADTVPLHVIFTKHTLATGIREWTRLANVTKNIVSATFKRHSDKQYAGTYWFSIWYPFSNLTCLRVLYSHVFFPDKTEFTFPIRLQHLELHKLHARWRDHQLHKSTFCTDRLVMLTSLRSLKLSFGFDWRQVDVGDLSPLSCLTSLEIRNAPVLSFSSAHLAVDTLILHSLDGWLRCPSGITFATRHLELLTDCGNAPPRFAIDGSRQLHSFHVSCAGPVLVSGLPDVRSVRVSGTVACIDLATLPLLENLTVYVEYGLGFPTTTCSMPPLPTQASVYVGCLAYSYGQPTPVGLQTLILKDAVFIPSRDVAEYFSGLAHNAMYPEISLMEMQMCVVFYGKMARQGGQWVPTQWLWDASDTELIDMLITADQLGATLLRDTILKQVARRVSSLHTPHELRQFFRVAQDLTWQQQQQASHDIAWAKPNEFNEFD